MGSTRCDVKWSSLLCVGITLVGMLCIPGMAAASESSMAPGGRITFTGLIVEPTCTASIDVNALMPADHGATPSRVECGGSQNALHSGRFYSLTVVDLESATIDRDRVLEYFSGYVRAAGNISAKLVTQTYE
jgi:type 1 fimbria pilin